MKTMKSISILMIASLLLVACEDWLDVKPKTVVESSELFETETGYKDALWGIYSQMTEASMYGMNMTITLDAMAKIYSRVGTSSALRPFSSYNFTSSQSQSVVNAVWQNTYSTIANLNNLIANIQLADKGIFAKDNYNVIYGEALGLRAFLHFDLLRLFAPSYADDPEAAAIPYVVSFNSQITKTSTVSEVIELILKDLETATALLKESDPMVTHRSIATSEDDVYLLNRNLRFNYYAAVATMARVYHYKGDTANAKQKAQEVIDHSGCKWTSVDDIATTEEERDHTFTSEQIFALKVENMEKNIEYTFSLTYAWANSYSLSLVLKDANKIFPDANDWRGWGTLYCWSDVLPISGTYRMPIKFWQHETMPEEYKCLMPMIRLPEMKLIVAECDPLGEGAEIINEIREHRGMTVIFPSDATEEEVIAEIRNEYHREFYGEGCMWYYYKRKNSATILYYSSGYESTQKMTREKYVWPMPDEEIEFGNRNLNTEE